MYLLRTYHTNSKDGADQKAMEENHILYRFLKLAFEISFKNLKKLYYNQL